MPQSRTQFPEQEASHNIKGLLCGSNGRFLRDYIRLGPKELEDQIMTTAERAWNVQPYPCIAKLLFLHFDLSKSPIFDRIVSMLDTDSLLLDLGCALGQDIRRLVYDGAPAESIVGMDIHQEFIDVGYELFRDRHNLKARFIVGDFFKSCPGLEDLAGSIRVINSGYFMHLFTWEGQVDVAKRMISLMARREGDIITGVNFGNQTSGFWEKHLAVTGPMFLHDSASLSAIWRQIGQETQTHWRVWSSVEEDKEFRKLDAGGFRLRWFVELEHCVPANPCEYTMDKMSQKPDILQEHYGDRLMSDAHDDEIIARDSIPWSPNISLPSPVLTVQHDEFVR